METNNELLLHIYEASDMGKKSLTKLLNILKKKDNKIKKEINKQLKCYETIYKESKKLLDKKEIKKGTPNIMASLSSNIAMVMEIDKDNSDTKIADILLRGYTMGVLEIEKKLNDYKKISDRKIINLAKKLLDFQKQSVEELKRYL